MIRVAYDVSFFGSVENPLLLKTGVGRTIDEIASVLHQRSEVDLTAVSLCADDVLSSNLVVISNLSKFDKSVAWPFLPSCKSKLFLLKLYQKYFARSIANMLLELPTSSLKMLPTRVVHKLLRVIKSWDVVPCFSANSFDIFHSTYLQLPSRNLIGSLPRILTIYDLIPVTEPGFVVPSLSARFHGILNSIDQSCDWIICISEYTKNEFCQYTNMSEERVFVAPLAAAEHFHPVNNFQNTHQTLCKYKIPGDYFLSLAAPQPRKNLVHLIRCFFRLLAEHPAININLVLVGAKDLGWLNQEIYDIATKSSRFSSRVIFTGYVPDEDLSQVYSGARAFIFPSLYEGFGLPVLEAMQCGVPVITSNTTSLPEVVGNAGILVDPMDEDALCQAMLNLIRDSSLCKELSKKSLERSKEFSWSKCASDIIDIYQKVAS